MVGQPVACSAALRVLRCVGARPSGTPGSTASVQRLVPPLCWCPLVPLGAGWAASWVSSVVGAGASSWQCLLSGGPRTVCAAAGPLPVGGLWGAVCPVLYPRLLPARPFWSCWFRAVGVPYLSVPPPLVPVPCPSPDPLRAHNMHWSGLVSLSGIHKRVRVPRDTMGDDDLREHIAVYHA